MGHSPLGNIRMDRKRLKDIQTADLSESNINEDFLHWMKTKGPSYVLIIMIVIAGYMFFVKYNQGKVAYRAEAWIAYIEAALYKLGLLSAADGYMRSVIIGKTIGSNANITSVLSNEDRIFYLQKADSLYALTVEDDDHSEVMTLLIITGLNGRASVAESNGDIDAARSFYEAVIARSQSQYPALAQQAQRRIDTLDVLAEAIVLPTDAEVTARNNQVLQRDPAPINTSIDALTDLTETGQ